MNYTAIQIANKIISNTDIEHGELISNLKLQKLLYYVQGYYLAITDKPLFKEDIVAWQYGPVVIEVYEQFKKFGSSSIELDDNVTLINMSEEDEDIFNEVLSVYSDFSAIKLMNMTHDESPWKDVFHTNPQDIITLDSIKAYFKTQLVG